MITHLILIAALAQAGATELNQGDVAPKADGTAPAPAKKPGPDVSKMPFTPYSIQEVVKFHLPEIQKCYDDVVLEIGKNPPEGKVMAVFSVASTGLTDKVKIDRKKTTIKNQRIQDCVTDAIRGWEFPKPTDGREHPIEYPFELKVAKEK
ncbi:MAG: AgmX/PglI C-terminal domain-containing protein [Deltaproteobacteria bacterium]|nr:AgmX/PglI C-terminal domain-containing protein [Deltaproteobacteria bacterium]